MIRDKPWHLLVANNNAAIVCQYKGVVYKIRQPGLGMTRTREVQRMKQLKCGHRAGNCVPRVPQALMLRSDLKGENAYDDSR